MNPTDMIIAAFMAVTLLLFVLWRVSQHRLANTWMLLDLARREGADVYESYKCLKGNLDIETRTHRVTRGELEEARAENRKVQKALNSLQKDYEDRGRMLSETIVGRGIYENEVRSAVEKGEKVPVRDPVRGCESSSAEVNRAALGQVDKRRSPPPAPAMRQGTDGSRHELDQGSQMLQTAVLMSAFDSSPAREKEITDAQDSSHRSAGHQPVCSPSYESRDSGSSGESHSSHSSSDSGSSGSSDSGSSGSCD